MTAVLAPRRARTIALVAVLAAAPVLAELVQSYLDLTGDLGQSLFLVLFLAPLYGGSALLVRELSVRTGRGWPGRLLLAGAFGVLMPTWVDLSLWIPQTQQEVALWGDIRAVQVAGVSVVALSSWALGHVLMSISAPVALVEALLPQGRGRPWLGRVGIAVLVVLALTVAVLIRVDEAGSSQVQTSTGRLTFSALLAAALVAVALTPWGRPVVRVPGRGCPRPVVVGLLGLLGMAAFDLAPTSALGLVQVWATAALAGLLVLRWARSPGWTWRHLGALAYGAVLERTLVSFLAPTPPGGDADAKLAQNVVVLVLVVLLGVLLERRTRGDRAQVTPATA